MEGNEFIGYMLVATGRAILFQDHFWHVTRWLPRSQMEFLSEPSECEEVQIRVKDWLCEANGLPEFTEIQQ